MNIHTCQTIRRAEQALFDSGVISSDELMEIAISESLETLARDPFFRHCEDRFTCVVVYAGKGKNAGDAIGLAWALGFRKITLRSVCRVHEMAQETQQRLNELPDDCLYIEDEPLVPQDGKAFFGTEGVLIIDGLLGSGASGALRPKYAEMVQEMNALRAAHPRSVILAVDVPTGLGADDGAVHGSAVEADATIAIGCVKPGLVADGAEDYVGRLICVPLPDDLHLPPSNDKVLDESALQLLPRRPYSCYKNRAGRVRIVAGSVGYTGAAEMCAEAALASGAGLVELYCLPSVYPILAVRLSPEVMVHPIHSYADVPREGADAMLIGPGLGKPDAAELPALQALVEQPTCPLVLDADGLNLTAEHGWSISPRAILTPHPGEMRRLYPAAAQLSRAACATRFVQQHPCTLLLKGARSIITDGSALLYNSTGGPYMATGGQGDVLSGVIAAFVAQGLSPVDAAALGAYSCGLAATLTHTADGEPLAVRASSILSFIARLNY